MQFTNIIGLPVFSIYECNNVGYIINAIFNKNMTKIKYLIVADDENEVLYIINIRNIYKLNNDCLLIKNNTKLSVNSFETYNIINNTVLDLTKGKDVVKDLTINNNFEIESIDGKNSNFKPEQIIYKNNNIILIDSNNQLKRKNFRPRKNKIKTQTTTNQTVSILQSIGMPTPVRVNNLNNIIGKKLADNLYSRQNEILATKNSLITNNTINIAKQFNVVTNLLSLAK